MLAQHNVSRLIDRLAAEGLVTKQTCEDDGRGLVVALTAKARQLLRAMWPAYRAAIQKHVGARLSRSEATALADALGKLLS